ncbi:MAG: DUF3108 domain-containing protein, partial [Bryobacteraceae bacterium]
MRLVLFFLLAAGAFAGEKAATAPAPAPFSSARDESLHYNINWPSELSLGESQLSARSVTANGEPAHKEFQFTVDAAVPGFEVHDQYHSLASQDFCSTEFDKSYTHGKRKAEEKIEFDTQNNTATRETLHGGGKSDLSTAACAKDPLTYVQFLRHELSDGRLPPPQAVIFGAAYQVRVEFAGAQTLRVGDKAVETDHLTATIKGPSSEIALDLYFARDAARTPVLVK